MSEFRYEQFCPVARACEMLASRWTLLIVRDLLAGPLRFSDLQRALPGVSSSVLADRLAGLEEEGLVERRELPPPAASTVYALSENGRALEPALNELMRWGVRFMARSRSEDHLEPRWLPLGLRAFARSGPTPPHTVEVRVRAEPEPLVVRVCGGPGGARVEPGAGPADAVLEAEPRALLGLITGLLAPAQAVALGQARIEGDPAVVEEFSQLFEMDLGTPNPS